MKALASLPRLGRIDALRGLAMLWMTLYHFCFDLDFFGWIQQDFYRDPFWTWQRTAIVSLFLLCAGSGQAIAWGQGQSWQRFGRRWVQVAAAALVVSLGSWWMYPQSFIYFGVLHGLAVMLVIARLTASWGRWLYLAGALAIASPWLAAAVLSQDALWQQAFNGQALNWLGWVSSKPRTEDYVPVFPWLGVLWWGMAATQTLLQYRAEWLTGAVHARLRWLAWLGTWSLAYYLLHQPVLLGLLHLVKIAVP